MPLKTLVGHWHVFKAPSFTCVWKFLLKVVLHVFGKVGAECNLANVITALLQVPVSRDDGLCPCTDLH